MDSVWNRLCLLSIAFSIVPSTFAQSPPVPSDLTVLNSTVYPGASISFKETQICETTKDVKSYSGYVNLPPNPAEGRNHELHTWFWFFEARNNPQNAPLALWLQGGPGSPSSPAAVGEHGPCRVLPSLDTELNSWSWNDRVNMLYIDQPVQAGFSYDTLIEDTINEVLSPFAVSGDGTTNSTVLAGVFSSQNLTLAPTSTSSLAPAMWHFMQVWIQEFPGYTSGDGKYSIWGESYGGHYAPTFADYFNKQNERIAMGVLSAETTTPLHLETLGLVNACIDINTQMPFYPMMANNNTYGIELLNSTAYAASLEAIPKCLNLTTTCRTMSAELDPESWGNNTEVNQACLGAFDFCFTNVAYESSSGQLPSGVNKFDIASPALASFPSKLAAGYLNVAEVQDALGVPLNFTGNSDAVSKNFFLAGDFVKGDNLAIIGKLLDQGAKVAMMYGDRDYQCNWFGGEAISLAIESKLSKKFERAGYTEIETNAEYVGGAVRQHGNLSFSRVYQAGHEVPYYQPETAYQIFNRAMFGLDVATGTTPTDKSGGCGYSTPGNASALTSDDVPVEFEESVQCYFWDMLETCTPDQKAMFNNGSAITEDFILVGYKLADGTEIMF